MLVDSSNNLAEGPSGILMSPVLLRLEIKAKLSAIVARSTVTLLISVSGKGAIIIRSQVL